MSRAPNTIRMSLVMLILSASGCSLHEFRHQAPSGSALQSVAVTRVDEQPTPPSTSAQGRTTPTLTDAEEALRGYRRNILLVGEALLTLELMERGALHESEQRIKELMRSYPDKESALLITTLLNHWLSRTRMVSGQTGTVNRAPARPEDAAHDRKTVASLKSEGLDHYSRGDLNGAVSCWRRILELDPADAETRQFLQRAEAILRNRRAG